MRRHAVLLSVLLATAAGVLSACGAVGVPASVPSGSDSPVSSGSSSPGPSPTPSTTASGVAAPGEVLAQGTILQQGDALPQLCLGGVAESYPPQCSGPDLLNWDWDMVDQEETASGVTWGAYAVQGTWDGTAFTRTQEPIPLSLYDPIADLDPRLDPANPGPGNQADLEELQAELFDWDGPQIVGSAVSNGYVVVTAIYDDGTLQKQYDAKYGPDTVIVQSALRPVS
ncbi:hypothetical protein [Arthrobacter sp. CAN_A1]|uniref:hypothetical protein n=1 Tax=Arthrobacter sp. CAN_A1 TaxID=2787717 RepID=UPI0018C926B2